MTIREKGYHQWDGELQTQAPWKTIFLNGIRMVYRRKFVKLLFVFNCLPFVFLLIPLYISTRPELKMLGNTMKFLSSDRVFFETVMTNGTLLFQLMLMGIFFGVDLISGDIKSRSFPLYFSRPLERQDYLFGKYSILLFYYLLFMLVPALVLFLFKIIFTGNILMEPLFILAIFITPVLTSLFLASLTLLLSSLSGNAIYPRVMLILLFYMSPGVAALLTEIFNNEYFSLLSCISIIKQMSQLLFNTTTTQINLGWMSVVLVVLISVGTYIFLYRRIGKLEAQIESGN